MIVLFTELINKFRAKANSFSIRRKLLVAFLAVATVPLSIMGLYSLVSTFRSSNDNAIRSVEDKLRIAQLLWNVRMDAMATTARTISQDNSVILNMDLGLYQPLGNYLRSMKERNDLSMTLILDADGQVVASGGQEYIAPGEHPVPSTVLAKVVEGPRLVALHLRDSALMAAEALSSLDPLHELSILAIHPIFNFNQLLTGFSVSVMVFGLSQGEGSQHFIQNLRQQVGLPIIVSLADQPIVYSDGKADFSLPLVLKGVKPEPQWTSGIQSFYLGGSVHIGAFNSLLAVDSSDLVLGVALAESSYSFDRTTTVFVALGILLLAFMAAALFGLNLAKSISRPMVAVSDGAREIVNGNFNVRISVPSKDEIGLMAEEFNLMTVQLSETMQRLAREVEEHLWAENQVRALNEELEGRVTERTKELTNANEALAESLNLLRRTQRHLVETEKLAALGNLVAGLAHELNTPIGVSLTAASFLETRTHTLELQMADNKLTRHAMDDFLAEVHQAASMVSSNLNRTAEQIRFFKQIAVDQEAGVSGQLDLREFIEELNLSLSHHMKKGGHCFVNEVPEGIVMHTWPSPLYQVLSNLLMNALQHGFVEREGGVIRYTATVDVDRVILDFSDNGVGIATDIMHRIFDPFFTTKRGTGRTGLGLSIVYNLVSSKLGGLIECISNPDQGTTFRITLPMTELETLSPA